MSLRYYSSVKISYGYKFCTIIDTERQIYFRLRAQDFKIVDAYISESKGNKSDLLEEDIYSTYKVLFDFLFEKDVIFYDDLNITKCNRSAENFKYYSKISNAIIEIDKEKDYKKLFSDLIYLNCFYVEIRVSNDNVIDYVLQILNEFKSQFEEITIYFFEVENERFVNIVNYANENLTNIILVKRSNLEQFELPENVILFERDLSNKCCGEVLRNSFLVNRTLYNESVTYNNCLNLKIGIDSDGNIKNCPSMKESFGNIKDTSLEVAIEKPGFKKYWDLNKDKIHVCKDCEFRYICTDCRAYVEDPEDIHSKPLKCGYNPYTGEWSEWSTNPLKQKAIDFYGMREMVDEIGGGDSSTEAT